MGYTTYLVSRDVFDRDYQSPPEYTSISTGNGHCCQPRMYIVIYIFSSHHSNLSSDTTEFVHGTKTLVVA